MYSLLYKIMIVMIKRNESEEEGRLTHRQVVRGLQFLSPFEILHSLKVNTYIYTAKRVPGKEVLGKASQLKGSSTWDILREFRKR